MEFGKVNPIDEDKNRGKNEGETKRDANLLPARIKPPISGRFTTENQPSGETKSRGWWKKQKGKKLMQALLNLDFDGTTIDPETKQQIESEIKKQAALYFNVPVTFVTVEMVMSMKQIAKSIQQGDTGAFNSVMDRAYGRPKEHVEIEEAKAPQIILNFGKIGMTDGSTGQPIQEEKGDTPPIIENENDVKEDNI